MDENLAVETILDSLRHLWQEKATAPKENQEELGKQIEQQYRLLGEVISNA